MKEKLSKKQQRKLSNLSTKRKVLQEVRTNIPDPIGMTQTQFYRLVSITHNHPDIPCFCLYRRQYTRMTDLYMNDEHDNMSDDQRLQVHQLLGYLSTMLVGTAMQRIDIYF